VKDISRLFAWCFILVMSLVAAVFLFMGLAPRRDAEEDFQLQRAGLMPVLESGRVKPLDTLARVSLMVISGRQEYVDENDKTQPAIRWLFDVLSCAQADRGGKPGKSYTQPSYRIENESLRRRLNLQNDKATVFSLAQLLEKSGANALKQVITEGRSINPDDSGLTADERALADFAEQLYGHSRFATFETSHRVFRIDNLQVLALLGLEPRPGFRYGFDEFLPRMSQLFRESTRAAALKEKDQTLYDAKVIELRRHVELYMGLAMHNGPSLHLVVPAKAGDEWKTVDQWHHDLEQAKRTNGSNIDASAFAPIQQFDTLLEAYANGDKKTFNRTVESYLTLASTVLPADARTASLERWFNAFAPFYRCSVLYVLIFLAACVSWVWRDPAINRFALWFLIAVALIHTLALILRMVIQGRPPVTNLYSSAVFIGWFCVVLCIAMEYRFRNALATAVGALTGYATLLIAHYLGGSGDTLEMMQAVLDTNFWLATHVTTVTIGYSATFVAGAIGIVYLWQMLVTTVLNELRRGGEFPIGQAALFIIASLAASLFVAGLFLSIFAGLMYLISRDGGQGLTVFLLGAVLLMGAALYSVYLTMLRVERIAQTEDSNTLPPGTGYLEQFALTEPRRKTLTWMMYGTVCFAMLFSFVGTVLGGIWADQSWGRFWGWDPKENGALLIVIMNALILHARWGGMIKERGMAILTLVGNMVTMWSWFGTNQLGIGLHAYGFNNALVLLCRYFWLSQLALIGLALLPYRHCRDYTPVPALNLKASDAQPLPGRIAGKRKSTGIQPA
jgi:ABC-type transport system involved in cytochrome c biogenesis permease subunit